MAFYSVAAMLTSFATGLKSLCAFRFLLGAGESANWPGATKAVAEWFPRKESGWAVALFDSGSAIGGAIAPLLVMRSKATGDWRLAFCDRHTGAALDSAVSLALSQSPDDHPRLSAAERELILAAAAIRHILRSIAPFPYGTLFRFRRPGAS